MFVRRIPFIKCFKYLYMYTSQYDVAKYKFSPLKITCVWKTFFFSFFPRVIERKTKKTEVIFLNFGLCWKSIRRAATSYFYFASALYVFISLSRVLLSTDTYSYRREFKRKQEKRGEFTNRNDGTTSGHDSCVQRQKVIKIVYREKCAN